MVNQTTTARPYDCPRCRDRGEISHTDPATGLAVRTPCPACNEDGAAFAPYDDRQRHQAARDMGDGLPANYENAAIYARY